MDQAPAPSDPGLRPPAPFTSSGSSENFSGSLLAISSSFLDTQTWLLPRQKEWQGRQVPPPTAEPTNSGRHCSQWLPWRPDRVPEGLENHGATTARGQALGAPREGGRIGAWLGQPQPTCDFALCLHLHTSSGGRGGGSTLPQSKVLSSESPSLNSPESPHVTTIPGAAPALPTILGQPFSDTNPDGVPQSLLMPLERGHAASPCAWLTGARKRLTMPERGRSGSEAGQPTLVWLRQSRQWSRAPTPAHSLWRLQRHSVEQLRPTKPKWQRQ